MPGLASTSAKYMELGDALGLSHVWSPWLPVFHSLGPFLCTAAPNNCRNTFQNDGFLRYNCETVLWSGTRSNKSNLRYHRTATSVSIWRSEVIPYRKLTTGVSPTPQGQWADAHTVGRIDRPFPHAQTSGPVQIPAFVENVPLAPDFLSSPYASVAAITLPFSSALSYFPLLFDCVNMSNLRPITTETCTNGRVLV